MATPPEHDPKPASHTNSPTKWSVDELIAWIEQDQNIPLDEDERAKLRAARVTGLAFLSCDGDWRFFRDCGLSHGTAMVLAKLSMEPAKGERSTGIKRSIQQAGDANVSDSASKKPRLESDQQLAESARQQRELIRQKIKELCQLSVDLPFEGVIPPPNFVKQFSEPAFGAKLPFPFVIEAYPDRFNISPEDAERNWPYVGREKFTTLIAEFECLYKDDSKTRLIVYGTRGYGKSHLLAALVCLLAAGKTHVVYIPDCRELMKRQVRYIKAAMLFAWADDTSKQQAILTLDGLKAMDEFLEEQSAISNVFFVIDQLNALETEKDDDQDTISVKSELRRWLDGLLSPRRKGLLSSSANNHKILGRSNRQDNYKIMYAYGGLTKKELACWWERKEKVERADGEKFKDDEKFKVEDFTGCIPLLLNKCIVKGKISLNSLYFEAIGKDAATFESDIQNKSSKPDLETHYHYIKACIYGQPIQDLSINIPKLVDLRYFYDEYNDELEESVGHYSCGIARNAVGGVLLKKRLDYHDTEFLNALPEYIDNPSVAGFMIEHAVLASIAINGISYLPYSPSSIETSFFKGDIPSFDTSKDKTVLYIPQRYNFLTIDGIIVRTEGIEIKTGGKKPQQTQEEEETKPKLFMYPIQITLNIETHSDSRTNFFNKWKTWTRNLSLFEVLPEFWWISPEEAWEKPYTKNKNNIPDYVERNIPISFVSKWIWASYEEAGKQGKFRYENSKTDFPGIEPKELSGQEGSGE